MACENIRGVKGKTKYEVGFVIYYTLSVQVLVPSSTNFYKQNFVAP